jgi:hypothetical protein
MPIDMELDELVRFLQGQMLASPESFGIDNSKAGDEVKLNQLTGTLSKGKLTAPKGIKISVPQDVSGANLTPDLTLYDSNGFSSFPIKTFDTVLNATATTLTIPWPTWASRLQVICQAVTGINDPANYSELVMNLDGSGSANYYEIINSSAGGAGFTRHNGGTWAVLGYIPGGNGAGGLPDGNIQGHVITDFFRGTSAQWLSRGSVWLAGVGFDDHRIVGMLYAGAGTPSTNPTSIVLAVVDAARSTNKNFAANSRFRAYAYT